MLIKNRTSKEFTLFKQKVIGMILIMGMLFGQPVPHAQAAICDQVQFVSDLTVPDGTTFAPGTAFTKTWRLKNIGTCTWTTAYHLVWTGGEALGGPASLLLPVNVAPGRTLDISVKLIAPATSGDYKGLWMLRNASNVQFGIGATGTDPFWVNISVVQTSAVIYDFVANAPYAQWKSGAGTLPFPVTGGDDRGYAFPISNPHLEDDSIDAAPGLMTVPQNKTDGYIQATYPEIQVQKGDQIQTLVSCEFGATSCFVTFRVDYRLANGVTGNLWTWREAYDNKFFRKSISLDALAGKNVQFIFMVLASGSASGDRALWGSPRIVRAGSIVPPAFPPTLTPLPPPAPTLTPFASPPPTAGAVGCDKAGFVIDVTVPDGTLFSPGTTFVKTWRLKNAGTCTWTTAYKLVFYNGEQMNAPTAINMPRNIAPGVTVDLTVNMTAPAKSGSYRGYWILSNATGKLFGIGTDASKPIWVDVNVSGGSPTTMGYDFVANACSAQWKSGTGILPCPGTDGDIKGFAIPNNSTQLEDGTMGPAPSLTLAPELKFNGYIQGVYPLFTVLPGDHFRGSTGCAFGSNCSVTFRLDYINATGLVKTFWTWRESNDKKNNSFDLNLAPLAGQNVRFTLTILATGSATNDKVTWVAPSIVRLDTTGRVPPTLTPTNTPITMPGTIIPNPTISRLNMIDASNGWAVGGGYLLRTNDGGSTWYNVTMPGVQFVGNAFFQNSTRGWVFGPSPDMQSNVGTLFRTIDGGRTWTQYNTPFNGGLIQFLNDANGFALSGQPSGMNKQAVDLYQTTDGGATWVRKYTNNPLDPSAVTGLPFSGFKAGMTFRDTLRGWIGGSSPLSGSVYIYKTIDSGATWAQQILTLPSGYSNASMSTGAPTFFSANDGVLPVWMTLDVGQRDLFIYVTHDGGTTWTRSAGFARQGWNASFVSVNDGFTWNINGYLQVTHNAGASWTQVPSNINFGDDIPIMDFVSTTTGWMAQNQVNGVSPFFRTNNAGSTWTLLSGTAPTPFPTNTPLPPTQTPIPSLASLKATVTAAKLSCRYGPGAEYLYLYALNATANIKLVGRTDANNWVWVDGTNKCWVNASFLQVAGDPKMLPIVYPGLKLPVSPYYPGPRWASATRNGNSVGVDWEAVPISAGKYADAFMHQYILEVWRCEAGQIVFETLGTNSPSIVVAKDEAGCSTPSHGRVFVQEKHGYGGPVEVPWPASPAPASSQPASIPTSTSAPQDLPTFEQTLVSSLNAHNFDTAKSMMNGSFGFAFWGSQGTSYTPDLAVQQLQNYIGTTPLTADPNKDLTALLGGTNPYSILGLDPANSQALFVSGWGLDGKGEAILFATRLADGTPYWHSVLIAPTGFVANNIPTTHDAFCADTRIAPLIYQLKGSLNQSNGDTFSALVSPTHGVDVRLWAYASPVNFNTTSAKNIFIDATSYTWGGGPSGTPDIGTFKNTIQPKLLDVLNAANIETYCDNLTKVYPLATPWPYPNMRYYNLYKPATSAGFDFRTWLVGIEYINGQPYISALVTIVWEP